ncbi:probable E3 ubiquitin-protein ligase HIP1 [Camellia sinensis]|uniref:probable E3 ubiquitin-protein ligase HIP1 n=1 Tax=Camellia sinensis TaxID=4442 RepID=UPI0010368C18|nr:probable E3 ubiquitin-protein ligase HIP1 [Camellia sinensis]
MVVCQDGIIVHEQPLSYEEPDVHENMHLDVDDMSYEELLALEDQIGNVSTGLSEEAILAAVRQHCYLSMKLGPPVEEEPCCICQEDYVDGKELGKLNCGHEFHFNCIKQWLVQKNNCPICRKTAVVV